VSQRLDPSRVRHGRVNGRYFRENFAQGGIDLVQIVPKAAANAVYHWAAEQIIARRLAGELRNDPVEYAHALRHETQSLRHGAHEKLMRAFLDPEVFSGGVQVLEDEPAESQTRLTV
jgi:hypothetical protein